MRAPLTIAFLLALALGSSAALAADATLTPAEKSAGWRLLFDGKTRKGWTGMKGTPFPAKSWVVEDGMIRTTEDGSDGGLRAALLQHQIAQQIRDVIADSDAGTLAELCRRHRHLSYERLRGVLAGDVWMRLEDIAETAHVLELDVVVNLDPETGRH